MFMIRNGKFEPSLHATFQNISLYYEFEFWRGSFKNKIKYQMITYFSFENQNFGFYWYFIANTVNPILITFQIHSSEFFLILKGENFKQSSENVAIIEKIVKKFQIHYHEMVNTFVRRWDVCLGRKKGSKIGL